MVTSSLFFCVCPVHGFHILSSVNLCETSLTLLLLMSFLFVYRMVTLDPTLTKMLINKNENVEILAWDQLFERVFSKMNKCHQITFQGQDPVIRKGKIEAIEIKVEQRTGNKKVTLIRNLESYGIEPQEFAHKIQIKAACSTAVTQLLGKNINPGMQILAQGNQVALVANFLLDDYRIPKKYINGLDLLKSNKKKK